MTYRSAVDASIASIIGVSLTSTLVILVYAALQSGTPGVMVVVLPTFALVAGGTIWITFATSYTVGDGLLLVRSGPFRWRVPLDQITRITTSRSVQSAPALSLDRLDVAYGAGRHILISPTPRHAFLQELGEAGVPVN
ncbi:MAG TPA: PH domain-containing protein [Gemmatimonadales bacterium]